MKPVLSMACLFPALIFQAGAKSKDKTPKPTAAPPSYSWFDGNFAEAKVAAETRNVPLLVFFLHDLEGASESVNMGLIQSSDFISAVSSYVLVLALDSQHEQIKDKSGKVVCKIYGAVSCDRHKGLAAELFKIHAENGELQTPMYVLHSPKGEPVNKIVDSVREEEILEAAQSIIKKAGKGLSATDFAQCNLKLAEAEKHMSLKEFSVSYKLYQEILAKVAAGPLCEKVKKGIADIDSRGKEVVDSVVALKNKGAFLEAIREADGHLPRYLGSPTEAALKKERAKILSEPKAKAMLVPYELFLKARELESKGKKAEAIRAYKLIAEKYADTEEGHEAKARAETLEKTN